MVPDRTYTEIISIFLFVGFYIVSPACLSAQPDPLITGITVYDSENASDWSIQENLQVGDLQYGDREYTFTDIPEQYAGLPWIRTANDSKDFKGTVAEFSVADSVVVTIALDDRLHQPDWMAGWIDVGYDFVNSEDPPKTFSLYEKVYTGDAPITVEGLAVSENTSNYVIICRESDGTDTYPDQFTFPSEFETERSEHIVSQPVTITGISSPANISVSNGEYAINGDPYHTDSGVIENGDQLQLRLMSGVEYGQVTTMEVTVGAYSTNFSLRTMDDPATGWSRVPDILSRIGAPEFPDRDFSVTDYGAVGDDSTMNTEAFEQAITACADSGGGRVIVPVGVFRSGAIHLQSNVNLHLKEGATIRFSQDPADYLPEVYTRFEGTECYNYSPLVYAFEQENIAITGQGTLDGNADSNHWWLWKNTQQADVTALRQQAENGVPVEERIYGEGHYLRPSMIQPYRCTNVLIDSVTVLNGPMWHIHPVLSENVTVSNVTVNGHGPNNDGCNPESSVDVLIDNCEFNTGDDCIAIKSGRNADGRRVGIASENIVIQNCTMADGHGGVVMGSEISGSARNIFARNCYMSSPNLERGLRIKTNAMRGGVVENVYLRDISIGEVSDAVFRVNFYYGEGDNGNFTPIVRDVKLENVTSEKSEYALRFEGYERSPISNIQLVNCVISGASDGNLLRNVENLSLNRTTINGETYQTIIAPTSEPVTSVEETSDTSILPGNIRLVHNYPNPFNGVTTIRFGIERPSQVELNLYDITGRKMQTLLRDRRNAGIHNVPFRAGDLASGLYYYKLVAGDDTATGKMVLLK